MIGLPIIVNHQVEIDEPIQCIATAQAGTVEQYGVNGFVITPQKCVAQCKQFIAEGPGCLFGEQVCQLIQ